MMCTGLSADNLLTRTCVALASQNRKQVELSTHFVQLSGRYEFWVSFSWVYMTMLTYWPVVRGSKSGLVASTQAMFASSPSTAAPPSVLVHRPQTYDNVHF